VKEGRFFPKGGEEGSETRGKEVAPIRYRDMDENGAIKPLLKETRLGGITMSKKISWGLFSVLCLVVVGLMAGSAFAAPGMPSSGEKQKIKLVGYNDVQGRETLQVTTMYDAATNKYWAFIGHHNRPGFVGIHFNPITNQNEENGTTILDITDPKHPTVVVHIPNYNFLGTAQQNRNSRSTSVVLNFKGSGKDILVRNSEGAGTWYYEIFDITDITKNGGDMFTKIGNLQATDLGTLDSAHKGYLSPSGKYYSSSDEQDFREQHLVVWDISDVGTLGPGDWNRELGAARFVGRGWLEGQKESETEPADDISSPGRFEKTAPN